MYTNLLIGLYTLLGWSLLGTTSHTLAINQVVDEGLELLEVDDAIAICIHLGYKFFECHVVQLLASLLEHHFYFVDVHLPVPVSVQETIYMSQPIFVEDVLFVHGGDVPIKQVQSVTMFILFDLIEYASGVEVRTILSHAQAH